MSPRISFPSVRKRWRTSLSVTGRPAENTNQGYKFTATQCGIGKMEKMVTAQSPGTRGGLQTMHTHTHTDAHASAYLSSLVGTLHHSTPMRCPPPSIPWHHILGTVSVTINNTPSRCHWHLQHAAHTYSSRLPATHTDTILMGKINVLEQLTLVPFSCVFRWLVTPHFSKEVVVGPQWEISASP